ncbi:hypothetical protein [Brevifollis gellanilyticus]|uniref:hypothetical protein n=1 Tax=Brevifollis gellanilyticus TaxID=748831 RepID=UPI0011BFE3F1|nr:hypothetical protein [Brevifollis gellanilyticus]
MSSKALREGRLMETHQQTRQRCQRPIEQLKEHFRDEEAGLIVYAACRWTRPREGFHRDIVHTYHHEPVHATPVEGRIMRWEDALRTFRPFARLATRSFMPNLVADVLSCGSYGQ